MLNASSKRAVCSTARAWLYYIYWYNCYYATFICLFWTCLLSVLVHVLIQKLHIENEYFFFFFFFLLAFYCQCVYLCVLWTNQTYVILHVVVTQTYIPYHKAEILAVRNIWRLSPNHHCKIIYRWIQIKGSLHVHVCASMKFNIGGL